MKFDYKISKFYPKKQRTKATNCYIKQLKLLARRVCNIAKISDFLSMVIMNMRFGKILDCG